MGRRTRQTRLLVVRNRRKLVVRVFGWRGVMVNDKQNSRLTDSLLNWYPKIKNLDIPQPKTKIVLLTDKEYYETMDIMPNKIVDRVSKVIENFSLPVFIRTDQSSAKHYWKDTCFYNGLNLRRHLYEICTFNHCADFMGLPFSSIVVREYIPMDSKYTAFEGMPVNPERRYFIKDGNILCHHHYWIKEAIKNPSVDGWEQLSDEMNEQTDEEIKLLSSYAEKVIKVIDGFWSIDFCKGKDGKWYLIDMATGANSWHPKECEYNLEVLK
jgi:hypothetical protein